MYLDRPAVPEEVAAIAGAIAQLLEEEAAQQAPVTLLNPWRVAARVESLGIVRRIPGQLDLRYMGCATRTRLAGQAGRGADLKQDQPQRL